MFLNTKAIKRFLSRGKPASFGGARESFVLDTGNAFLGGEDIFDSSLTAKKIVFSAFAASLAILLQEAVFNDLRIFGVKPNIVLAVILLISMSSEAPFALCLGLFTGIAIDVSFGRYLGFYALLYMFFCVIASAVVRPASKGKFMFYVSAGPVFLFLYTFILGFGARFLSLYASKAPVFYEDFGGHLLRRIVPSSIYTYLIFLILLVPVTLALKKFGRVKSRGLVFRQ